MISDQQLADFCAAVDAMRAPYFEALNARWNGYGHGDYVLPLSFSRGPKYARIVREDGKQKAVYCFVRLDDGAIMKADGWSKPAKSVRGNIANGAADMEIHGARYAR